MPTSILPPGIRLTAGIVGDGGNNEIATFTDTSNIQGEGNLTFDGTDLTIASGSIQVRTIDYSDGDNAITIADGGGVTFAQSVAVTGGVDIEGGAVFNESHADVDFRVEGDTNANLLVVNAGDDEVGIGIADPGNAMLHVYATSGTGKSVGEFEAAIGSYTGTSLIASNTLGSASSYFLFKGITDSDGDASGPFTEFSVRGDGLVTTGSSVFINETANGAMTTGLTINQGTADDEIFTLKSSDVAHGITGQVETDTYGLIKKRGGADGGLYMWGLTEAIEAIGFVAGYTTSNTTKSVSGRGGLDMDIYKKDGTGFAAPSADDNIVVIKAGATARFIFDAEGSGHADVEWVAYDNYDDLALVSDMEYELLARENEAQTSRRKMLEKTGIIGKDSWHIENDKPRAMVNMTKLSMLHHGALMQANDRIKILESRLLALEGA